MARTPRVITIRLTDDENIQLQTWLKRAIGTYHNPAQVNVIRKFAAKINDEFLKTTLDPDTH